MTIDVTGDEDHIRISVTDTGLGIPAEDQVHLFQKFYRVDNSDTREIGGTGLGLYLCRRLTETMGGRIWVESEYKKGSTFYVELPRVSHEDATRMIENAAMQPQKIVMENKPAPLPTAQPATPTAAPTMPQPQQPQQVAPTPAQAPPVATPAPVAAPQVATPQVNQPLAAAPQMQPQNNTPLTAIEANPGQYTRARVDNNISVPPRQVN